MGEHRVSMLGASLRRFEDPARSADPRIRELVARLATLEAGPAPRAHFRAELRAQLVAVAPRLVAAGPAVELRRPGQAAHKPAAAAQPRGDTHATRWISIARPLAMVSAFVALCAVVLGGAVWLSTKTLPGDALYALKRANENVALSMAGGDAAKGRAYLKLAKTRAEEASALLSRSGATAAGAGVSAAGSLSGHTAKLVQSTLDSADADTGNGSQLLGGDAVRNDSATSLSSITDWAPGQIERLRDIAGRLAPGALHNRAAASTQLASSALSRARALGTVLSCKCLNSAATDELGPVPCTVCSPAPTTGSVSPPAPTPTPTPTGSVPANQSSSPTGGATATMPTATGPNPPVILPSATGSGAATGAATGAGAATDTGSASVPEPGGSTGVPVPTLPSVPSVPIDLPPVPTLLPGATSGASPTATCTLSAIGLCIP
jgi:hypothetical protein